MQQGSRKALGRSGIVILVLWVEGFGGLTSGALQLCPQILLQCPQKSSASHLLCRSQEPGSHSEQPPALALLLAPKASNTDDAVFKHVPNLITTNLIWPCLGIYSSISLTSHIPLPVYLSPTPTFPTHTHTHTHTLVFLKCTSGGLTSCLSSSCPALLLGVPTPPLPAQTLGPPLSSCIQSLLVSIHDLRATLWSPPLSQESSSNLGPCPSCSPCHGGSCLSRSSQSPEYFCHDTSPKKNGSVNLPALSFVIFSPTTRNHSQRQSSHHKPGGTAPHFQATKPRVVS
nr:uncharacterized protein LOC114095379 [Marmota flaviventris]